MAGRPEVEVAVVGAGLMGAATAWAATREGLDVTLLERYEVGHARGSSHGSARIVRRAYADRLYVRMTGEALRLWRELEDDAGTRLLRMTGAADQGVVRAPERIAAVLADQGVPHEVIPATEAERRWSGLRFEGPVLYHPDAGTVDAAAAVSAFVERARARGAEVRERTPVRRIEVLGPEAVRLVTDGGSVTARRAVVAAGAWAGELLGGLVPLPELTVTQQQIFHFPPRDRSVTDGWPVLVHDAKLLVYGLPGGADGGPRGGWKLAEHDAGRRTTARTRDGVVDPAARERITAYVRDWLPGLVPEPFNEATCLYTSAPRDDFVLDRRGPLVVCSPCSGHGAKFAPLIGAWTAALATGGAAPVDRFRLPSTPA
ncbi:FAD-dependent oxidoreductase [Streptomyces sp. NPDC102406]|uniref:FAD-dependent oxidoreductase n=1 Tax=Streptomyces sp. NPDC102406 TaxID=3366171 RepID=UPI003807C155